MFDAERFRALLEEQDISQSELGRRVGISQSAIHKLASGNGQGSKHIHKIARELRTTPEYLMGETDNPSVGKASEDRLAYRSEPAENTVSIPVIDLAYGMGGTYLDEYDAEARTETFPLSFIRRYTKAKAEDLVIADGLGDSMAPTIGSSDQMLIDRSLDTMRLADQVWAFSFGGVGMVKRLRPRPDGSIAILSDNPTVPEDRAVDDELHLIGRVVAVVRKL